MPNNFSSYLKLHRGEEIESQQTSSSSSREGDLSDLLAAFAEATGWRACPVGRKPFGRPSLSRLNRIAELDQQPDESKVAEGVKSKLPTRLELLDDSTLDGMLDITDSMMIASQQAASNLLDKIEALVQALEQAEEKIERQEVQLASTIGLTIRPEESDALASRIQESLQRAAMQTASDAAAIYLLDESTSELSMRSCWGLPKRTLLKSPRPLRGSLADLEAMLGNAVLLENTQLAQHWNCPEDFPAAMCVPIGSPSSPQGTLWLWSQHVRDFSSLDVESAKAASDKILADLERSALTEEVLRTRSIARDLESASILQASRLATPEVLHHDYEIAGWTHPGQVLSGQFHNWTYNHHGDLLAALGDAEHSGATGAVVATSLQSVVETCWNAKHEPKQILRKANDLMWSVPDGDWRCSLGYLQVDAQAGVGKCCIAGSIQAFIVGSRGFRMLGSTSTLVGQQPDTKFQTQSFRLEGGDLVVLVTRDVISGLLHGGFTQTTLLNTLRQLHEEPVQEIADHLARMLPMQPSDKGLSNPDRSLVILRRKL